MPIALFLGAGPDGGGTTRDPDGVFSGEDGGSAEGGTARGGGALNTAATESPAAPGSAADAAANPGSGMGGDAQI
ncbi:hypothetical protein E4P40_23545, partial [Blastococcus sp. CT_GayMR20]